MNKSLFYGKKRGNISITILVLLVLAICSLTLLSFYVADRNAESEFRKVRLISMAGFLSNQADFYFEADVDSKALFDKASPAEERGLTSPFNSYTFSIEEKNGAKFLVAKYFENSGFLWLKQKETVYVEYPLD